MEWKTPNQLHHHHTHTPRSRKKKIPSTNNPINPTTPPTQAANPLAGVPYKNVADCFMRVLREEGLKTFYAPLAPRLVSVVPMIGIQVRYFVGRMYVSMGWGVSTRGVGG